MLLHINPQKLYVPLIVFELLLLVIALAYLFTGLAELSRYYPPIQWVPVVV